MKLLLTAFDPFGGEPVNPALEAVKLVSDTVGSVQVVKLEVPTVFGKSIDKVAKAIEAERPDAVLCIGQAGGRFDLTPERVAINLDDARIKDNEGNQPIDVTIFEDGALLILLLFQLRLWYRICEMPDFLPAFPTLQEPLYATT